MIFSMITVTVLTKNCALTLPKTLESLAPFAEVVILDTGSTDGTVELAQRFPNVKVFTRPFRGFGPTHNEASGLASNDWIFSVDSDEVVSPELAQEILSCPLDSSSIYGVLRQNFFKGKRIKWCAGWHPDPVLRLYHRQKTAFSEAAVHEKIVENGLQAVFLQSPLLHVPYREISDFLTKMQTYSTLFAEQNRGKKKSSIFRAIWHGFHAFIKSYLFKRGFLGGREGFIISIYNGHTAFYKYLKLDELNKKI